MKIKLMKSARVFWYILCLTLTKKSAMLILGYSIRYLFSIFLYNYAENGLCKCYKSIKIFFFFFFASGLFNYFQYILCNSNKYLIQWVTVGSPKELKIWKIIIKIKFYLRCNSLHLKEHEQRTIIKMFVSIIFLIVIWDSIAIVHFCYGI